MVVVEFGPWGIVPSFWHTLILYLVTEVMRVAEDKAEMPAKRHVLKVQMMNGHRVAFPDRTLGVVRVAFPDGTLGVVH